MNVMILTLSITQDFFREIRHIASTFLHRSAKRIVDRIETLDVVRG